MESAERFISEEYDHLQGRLHTDHGQMMQGLLDDKSLRTFVTCTPSKVGQNTRGGMKSSAVMPCTLDVVVYGPSDLSEEIGSWFEDYDIYLQDPQICHLDARYSNPHRLSSTDPSRCPLLSEVVSQSTTLIQLSEIAKRPDLLSSLGSAQDLEETAQPASIKSTLKKYAECIH